MSDDALDLAGRIAAIDDEKKSLALRQRQLEDERRGIETRLIDVMCEKCVNSVRVFDRTVYIHRQTWARIKDPGQVDAAVEVARRNGWGDVIAIGTQRLSAHVREAGGLENMGPGMTEHFVADEQVSIRSRT